MVKHTLKSLRYEHRKIFKVCLIISLFYMLENTTYIGLTSCFICYNNGFSEQKKCETLSSKTTISCTVTSSKNFLQKNYGIQDGKKIKNFPSIISSLIHIFQTTEIFNYLRKPCLLGEVL